jgi:hypothetical protein
MVYASTGCQVGNLHIYRASRSYPQDLFCVSTFVVEIGITLALFIILVRVVNVSIGRD